MPSTPTPGQQPDGILSLEIEGFRPFGKFQAFFGELEVIVGANGSGKSSLFEFLKFLRDGVYQELPPEILSGSIGQQIFHRPGPDRFAWRLEVSLGQPLPLAYSGVVLGPIGRTTITEERVETARPLGDNTRPLVLLDVRAGKGLVYEREEHRLVQQLPVELKRPNQLVLSTISNPKLVSLVNLREFIHGWRFYNAFNIANARIREAVVIEEAPTLREDAGNLSALLHYLMTEERPVFDELQSVLALVVPGFKSLSVKARGGPGRVIAFWQERGVDDDLTLADLSDGTLRLICWSCLALMRGRPTLLCIDEPDQGLHPRALAALAGLFRKRQGRCQVLLATHSSYFLTCFDHSEIAVVTKRDGEARFRKISDSAALIANLEDFGAGELEIMHRNDELEALVG